MTDAPQQCCAPLCARPPSGGPVSFPWSSQYLPKAGGANHRHYQGRARHRDSLNGTERPGASWKRSLQSLKAGWLCSITAHGSFWQEEGRRQPWQTEPTQLCKHHEGREARPGVVRARPQECPGRRPAPLHRTLRNRRSRTCVPAQGGRRGSPLLSRKACGEESHLLHAASHTYETRPPSRQA